MMGGVEGTHRLGGRFDIPYDPSDFGRCHRLLQLIPEWRANLGKVAEIFPGWKPMVDAWGELEDLWEEELPKGKLPKLYERIQGLVNECRLADGWKQTSPYSWSRD
ncbi:MAG TPA: hypothetical protein DCP69_12515 [Candidatus Omnitrophica bacterium]|nr:hypothetical protein [Candidatus Omnitrophota bacterium]